MLWLTVKCMSRRCCRDPIAAMLGATKDDTKASTLFLRQAPNTKPTATGTAWEESTKLLSCSNKKDALYASSDLTRLFARHPTNVPEIVRALVIARRRGCGIFQQTLLGLRPRHL
jgi:hypothetical protein